LSLAIPKLDGDNIDLEEDNVEMEEENSITYRKRSYMCVNRPEITDTEQRNESSESATSTRRLNINERVTRLLAAVHKFECDNIDMEEDKVDIEEDNINIEEDNIPTYSKRPETTDTENSNDSSEYSCNSSEYSNNSSEYSSNSSEYSSNSSESSSISSQYSSDSSESIPSVVVQRGNINERVARLLATVPTLEGDNMEMEEDNSLTNRKRKYQSVKSHETTDIDQRSKHSVSIPVSVIEQECNDAMKRVARWILAIPNFESDTMEIEEDIIEMEKENIRPEHVYI
jgi:hypothetical protein